MCIRDSPYLYEQSKSLPPKTERTTTSVEKEDKELEEALKLSLTEYEQQKQQQEQPTTAVTTATTNNLSEEPQYQQPQPQQPNIIRKVRALYDLSSPEADELSFVKGDVITVLEQVYKDWWRGTLRGNTGIFPLNYVTPISDPTPQELQMENERTTAILQQRNDVDQLHSILKSNSNTNDPSSITQNPEINDIYGGVTPLRPQITRLIGKYAQEKDDLTSLHQILGNAELTYNRLLDRAANSYNTSNPMAYGSAQPPPLPGTGYAQSNFQNPMNSQAHSFGPSVQNSAQYQQNYYPQDPHQNVTSYQEPSYRDQNGRY